MVVVFGSINLDLIARVPRLPAAGETLAGTAFATAPGGKGANQALAARRAGAEVAMVGAVGQDAFADAALANLKAAKVDLAGVRRMAGQTGVALILVDERGENCITVVPGANASTCAEFMGNPMLRQSTILMQLEVAPAEVATVARRAKALQGRVILNAAPALPLPPSLTRDIDVLIVNEVEAAHYAHAWNLPSGPDPFMRAAGERFGFATVITLGARGAMSLVAGGTVHVPAPEVTVVDTTGAGDAFCGAFAAALDSGDSLEGALRLGVRAGAQACTYAGAQSA